MAKKTARKAKSRTRARDIRGQIIEILERGSTTRFALQKATGASIASIDAHLADMRRTGEVQSDGKRPATFSKGPGKGINAPGINAPGMNAALRQALVSVVAQMREKERVGRARKAAKKIATLEKLAEVMPLAVAKVLREIIEDYQA